jgi:hypothetical protein
MSKYIFAITIDDIAIEIPARNNNTTYAITTGQQRKILNK